MRFIFLVVVFISQLGNARQKKTGLPAVPPTVFALTRVMMHDVVNPPAAARFYSYGMLGAWTIMSQTDAAIIAPGKLLKGYNAISLPTDRKNLNVELASLYCILETGRLILPSGYMIDEDIAAFREKLKKEKWKDEVVNKSIEVAIAVAKSVVAYAKDDNYGKLSTRLRYTPTKGEAYWYPTPPAYMEAVEPNWKTIRTMLIDSCNQFIPLREVPFSKDSSSAFYKLAAEVYWAGKNPKQDEIDKAAFWDCNPFVVSTAGHMAIGFKKISPGGHWMSIAGIASQQSKLSFAKTVFVHSIVALTLMDAFISCWDEKYRSNRIRPETFINKYIDRNWQPMLQTPPFPEYTSGHSVVSGATAEVLTYLLGDNYNYTDDSEAMFELPARTFTSFRQAAEEAAISRLYGGIHYRDAIENGLEQGRRIGNFIVQKLSTAGATTALDR